MDPRLHRLAEEEQKMQRTHVPQFFRLSNKNDAEALGRLLDSTPHIHVFDELMGQLEELVKLQNPRIKFTKEKLTEAAKSHIGKTPSYEYGAWIYYPWSARL